MPSPFQKRSIQACEAYSIELINTYHNFDLLWFLFVIFAQVLSIDLSNNKLYSLTIFSKLAEKATSLRSLNLAKNVVSSVVYVQ